jgi:hypothetical protein
MYRSFRRAALTAAATAAALVATTLPAHAADSLDRDYTGTVNAGNVCAESRGTSGQSWPLAISFDPLSTGALSHVVLPLTPYLAGSPAVTIQVVDAWGPTSPRYYVVAEATIPAATVLAGPAGPTGTGHVVDVAFTQRPVLRRGDRYFVVLRVADDPAGTSRYCVSRTNSSQQQVYMTGNEQAGSTLWLSPPNDPGHVLVLADHLTTAATHLSVASWVNTFPVSSPVVRYRAELTAGNVLVPGEQVTFSAGGRTLCTATTDTHGIAECDGMSGLPAPDGYDASFAGTALLLPTTGHGSIVA